jgi:hypothetical protein
MDVEDIPIVIGAVLLNPTVQTQRRRVRRQQQRSLPKIFLVYNMVDCKIVCAVVLATCSVVAGRDNASWCVARVAMLQQAVPVPRERTAYVSNVFSLLADFELEIRGSAAVAGGTLNHHFADYAALSWKVLSLSSDMCDRLVGFDGDAIYIETPRFYCVAIGVEPAPALPHLQPPIALDDAFDLSVGVDSNFVAAAASPLAPSAQGDVRARLLGLHTVNTSGTVDRRYTPQAILSSLQLARRLKPSAQLGESLSHAADLFFGADSELGTDLRNGAVPMPSVDLLRMARVRLDLMSILWERRLSGLFRYARYIMIDSSPQLGFNFLCMREDRIAIPRDAFISPEYRASFDINAGFETRICPISTLGLGNAGAVKKGLNTAGVYLMESTAMVQFHDKRCEVKGSTMDSGTEKVVGDDPVQVLPKCQNLYSPEDRMSYMYPNNLHLCGHLHVLFNALETAVKGLDLASRFMDCMLILQTFMSNKQLRRKFQTSCLGVGHPDRSRFDAYSTVHIDWRWEFLSRALDTLVPLYETLQRFFDKAKMLTGETGMLTISVVASLAQVLATPNIVEFGEMLRVVGKVLEKCAHKLEGCWCHADLWMSKGSFRKRTRALVNATGRATCVWKGRMGAWFAVVGRQLLLDDIMGATSERLEQMFSAMDARMRGVLLASLSQLRLQLVEEFREKLSFWSHVPYKALGIFYCCCGGTVEVSKRILKECIDEYTNALANNLGSKLHRVAHLIFGVGTICRRQLDAFLVGTLGLASFATAFVTLQEYALCSLVERRIEVVHAWIKKLGSQCTYVLPPYMCALLRQDWNLDRLLQNAHFHSFCIIQWRSRDLVDAVLALRYSRAELRAKGKAAKIKMVYQCSLSEEYESVAVARSLQKQWLVQTQDVRQESRTLPQKWKLCVEYLKQTMDRYGFYSLPTTMFNESLCLGLTCYDESDCDPVADSCRVVEGPTLVLEVDSTDALCVFQLINARPERRQTMRVEHVQRLSTCINVSLCVIVGDKAAGQQLIVHNDYHSHKTVDLVVLVKNMDLTLRSLFRWAALKKQAVQRLRPLLADDPSESYALPPLVGSSPLRALATSSSISQAVVALVDNAPSHDTAVLSQLCDAGAVVGNCQGALNVLQAARFDAGVVGRLRGAGAIVASTDEFGDLMLSVNPGALTWSVMQLLGCPVQHVRLPLPSTPLVTSKLALLLVLHQQGWKADAVERSHWSLGEPLFYRGSLAQPASYFAVLVHRADVLAKGVDRILHGQPDGYYRCLLSLNTHGLQRLLSSMTGRANAWFTDQLRILPRLDNEPIDDVDIDEEKQVVVGIPAPLALTEDWGLDGVLPSIVPFEGWTRKLVSAGVGMPASKVYFDNATHQSHRQRGWIDCRHHGCIKYEFCSGSQAEFCTYMHLWEAGGGACGSRHEHLQWKPSEASVVELVPSIVLVQF